MSEEVKKPKRNLDYLKIRMDSEGMTFICQRCDETYLLNLPASFNIVIGASKGWKQTHRGCKKKKDTI